jgi:2-(1,2-epoxy-1,2-dihydrophenyl)acetyl-CoA isomerase
VVNRLILTLSTLNGITVFAGQGRISLFHMNLSLAYDYRIITDDAVIENHNAGIGLITKGSGYYLPRILGVKKATEILQWKTFSAEEALQFGLVDRIVPAARLEEETFQFLKASLAGPASTCLEFESCSSAIWRSYSAPWNWKTSSSRSAWSRRNSRRVSRNTA